MLWTQAVFQTGGCIHRSGYSSKVTNREVRKHVNNIQFYKNVLLTLLPDNCIDNDTHTHLLTAANKYNNVQIQQSANKPTNLIIIKNRCC